MNKPRLLDLFCGAGGAGRGYIDAGFDVTGVDIAPQPDYPGTFIQGDALAYLAAHGHEYDAIHASPPCQASSALTTGSRWSLGAISWRSAGNSSTGNARWSLTRAGAPTRSSNLRKPPDA